MPNDPYIGEIYMGGFNFVPRYCAACNGQLLPINQNQALFSLLGTAFGGNGITTFALPDLRGRAPMGSGQGNGLSYRTHGEASYFEKTLLNSGNMPAHSHPLNVPCTDAPGNTNSPVNALQANTGALDKEYASLASVPVQENMYSLNTGAAGSGLDINIMQPYIALNFYIYLTGIFPSRN